MKNVKNIVKITATIAILFSFAMVFPTTTAASAQSDRTYQSEEDGFRLQIPEGWVIQDDVIDAPGPTTAFTNIENIAMLCPENEALPGIGGEHNCQAANLTDGIGINRWSDLQSWPEFANLSSPITTNDFVALWIQLLQNDTSQINIVNNTDVDEFTKIVDMTYIYHDNAGTLLPFDDSSYGLKNLLLFALSQDRNTGYNIVNILPAGNQTQKQQSPAVQEVFNSFEILE